MRTPTHKTSVFYGNPTLHKDFTFYMDAHVRHDSIIDYLYCPAEDREYCAFMYENFLDKTGCMELWFNVKLYSEETFKAYDQYNTEQEYAHQQGIPFDKIGTILVSTDEEGVLIDCPMGTILAQLIMLYAGSITPIAYRQPKPAKVVNIMEYRMRK